ncbi:prepilin-type N-terminal cleavage/methylation domain-containing protein [Arenicella xantha]|uniref:Type II secretion system protein H (GspH) n=1 Tax=Arenicella xantha TaxID=644221 RepID=A0A395JH73_9GAMM|nr:prepilin-type N-terminal cleavage/methylation domain-containing protein [Arenicella xantha]RBP47144.1 type II secretion system protein H (GspH) [Arenicella xantha]
MISTNNDLGFTMLELLVVIALMGLLLALVPRGMQSWLGPVRTQSAVQSLATALRNCRLKSQELQQSLHWQSGRCHQPSSLASVLQVSEQQSLTFNPDGSSTGGTLLLRDRASSDGVAPQIDQAWLLRVDRITSQVTIDAARSK